MDMCIVYETVNWRSKGVLYLTPIGVFLNLICLSVLLKPQMDSLFNRLLVLLTISDSIFLLGLFVRIGNFMEAMDRILIIINSIAIGMSAQTTLVIAIDRYGAISYPFKWNTFKTDSGSKRNIFITYLFIVINNACLSSSHHFVEESHFLQPYFVKIGIIVCIASIFTLVLLNLLIYRKLDKLNKTDLRLKQPKSSFTIILYIASISIIVYGVLIINIIAKKMCFSEITRYYIYSVAVYLNILNSTCNLFIYNLSGKKFRNILLNSCIFKKCIYFLQSDYVSTFKKCFYFLQPHASSYDFSSSSFVISRSSSISVISSSSSMSISPSSSNSVELISFRPI